jgi:hypothetical protein
VLLNSEEGVDVLKLSCSLGYMASEVVEAARDSRVLNKVEACVLHLIGRLREISQEMSSSLQYSIERSNFREIVHAIAVTALRKYSVDCQFSVDDDFFSGEHSHYTAVSPVVKLGKKGEPLAPCGRPAFSKNAVNKKSSRLDLHSSSGILALSMTYLHCLTLANSKYQNICP